MKVLIFENEISEIEPIFEVLQKDYEDFDYQFFTNSQSLKPFNRVFEFDKILVDLKLSDNTKMEGYDILEALKTLSYNLKSVAIITGHTDFRSKLEEKGFGNIKVIEKPILIDEIEVFLGLKS